MKRLLLIIIVFLTLLPLTLAQTYFKQCTYIWDSSTYINQEVNIIASVSDSAGLKDSDSVTINVVDYETGIGGAARSFDENSLDIQIIQPQGDIGSGAVEIKISAQGPNEIKEFSMSIRSGQGGVAFPISNRNCASGGVSGAGGTSVPSSSSGSGSGGAPGVPSSSSGSGGGGQGYTAPITEGIKDKYELFGKIGGDSAGTANDKLNSPVDIAIDSKNNIYVTDSQNNRIVIYNPQLSFLKKFPGEFLKPTLIYIDKNDNVYISDTEKTVNEVGSELTWGRLRKFDSEGKEMFKLSTTSIGVLHFYPKGLTVDSQGNVYISDWTGNNPVNDPFVGTIYIFDSSGKLVKEFKDSLLTRPEELAFDSEGNLYIHNDLLKDISSSITEQILVYDKSLNYKLRVENKDFDSIKDMVIDNDDFVYVVDMLNERVQVYDKKLNYIATIGGNKAGNDNNQLYRPEGIFVGSDRKVYITNIGNHRISIFSPVIPSSESGSDGGGGPGEFSLCEKYYVCPNGKEVQYCFIHKLYNEKGELAGAGCGCKSNPEILCIPESTGSSGSGGGPGVIKSIPVTGSGGGRGSNETPLICDGCVLGNKCVFVGYRANDKYCEISGEFKEQEEVDSSCENNFECSSNLCIDDKCVEKGLFRRILEFFQRLFGIKA